MLYEVITGRREQGSGHDQVQIGFDVVQFGKCPFVRRIVFDFDSYNFV